MASAVNDIRSSADTPTQDATSHEAAQSTSPSKPASPPHEHPPFNFQPVEMADLSNTREGLQPTAPTSNAIPLAAESRNDNTSSPSSPYANMLSNPNLSDTASRPSEQPTTPPSQPHANTQASPSNLYSNIPTTPMPPQPAHHRDMPNIHRTDTIPAIGAASDNPHSEVEPAEITSTMLMVTLLLSTGARHPFKLDDKYLKKRNVTVEDDNPINLSVYTLKELIWRDWRDDWDPRPTSPTSIRLIHYGKLLEDKSHLREGRFANGDTQHVVHMTVKPQDVIDDEDARIAKGAGRSGEDGERRSGCRCVIL